MTFLKKFSWLTLVVLITSFSISEFASAHFLYVYNEDGKVKVVFGEGLEPDQAQFLSGLSAMKAFTTVDGKTQEVEFEKVTDDDDGWFEVAEDKVGDAVDVECPYGVFGGGEKSMFLNYSGKYAKLGTDSSPAKPVKELTLDLVPEFTEGALKITAYFKGMPLHNAEVKLVRTDADSTEGTTGETGSVMLKAPTRYLIRAKHVVQESGEANGKKFAEKRYYCTMVLDVNGEIASPANTTVDVPTKLEAPVTLKKIDTELEDFPVGLTSFGATVSSDQVFVIGGKSGRAHSYAKSYQNRDVYCLSLVKGEGQWKTVGDNLGLQGLAIVSHGGKVYRIGGLEARNAEDEEHDLHSIADVMQFDPANGSWNQMPSLPNGRSSFDACVVDDKIYVVGGWQMDGENDSVWAHDMLIFDLSKPDAQWQSIAAPFRTRALAVRSHGGKIIAVGGIDEDGGPTAAVHFFDIASQQWSPGPEVPTGGDMKAFGCSAVSLGEHFLISTYDGEVFRLSDDRKSWQQAHQLETGRFFHHMLPVGESQFAMVGGSHMEHGSQQEIEVFQIAPKH